MNDFPKCYALTDLLKFIAKTIFSVVLGRKKLVSSELQHSGYSHFLRFANKIYLVYKL